MPKLILILSLFCLTTLPGCGEKTKSTSIEPSNYTATDAKEMLSESIRGGNRTFEEIQSFRTQAYWFSMSLIVTMLGFVVSRRIPARPKGVLMLGIACFCVMMYGLDANEEDLGVRQANAIVKSKTAILHIDSLWNVVTTVPNTTKPGDLLVLHHAELDTILMNSIGVAEPNKSAKWALFFSWRFLLLVWYGVPLFISCTLACCYFLISDKGKHPFLMAMLYIPKEEPH